MKHWTEYVEFFILAWPAISAVLTAVLKPRDPAGWAKLTKFTAAALKFIGAVGVDTPKVLKALKEFRDGHQAEPKDAPIVVNETEVQ